MTFTRLLIAVTAASIAGRLKAQADRKAWDMAVDENIADLGGSLPALVDRRASLKGAPDPLIEGLASDQRARIW